MKYKVGDTVRIKGDLEVGNIYCMENKRYQDIFTKGMTKYSDKIVEIEHVSEYGYYLKDDADYNFTDEMIDGYATQYIDKRNIDELKSQINNFIDRFFEEYIKEK